MHHVMCTRQPDRSNVHLCSGSLLLRRACVLPLAC